MPDVPENPPTGQIALTDKFVSLTPLFPSAGYSYIYSTYDMQVIGGFNTEPCTGTGATILVRGQDYPRGE